MIRWTELRSADGGAEVKIEGYLTQDAVAALSDILTDYARRRVERIEINANGLATLDRIAVRRWRLSLPGAPALYFHTSRKTLMRQLESCGLAVVFDDRE